MKYIITNCPAIEPYCTCAKYYDSHKQISTRCKDITDCVMKRIVERHNLYEFNYPVNQAIQMLTQNIKNMLEIEECK